MTGPDTLTEIALAIPKPIHGGAGDGALHIIQGTPLGQKTKDDPRLVWQDALDVSNGNTRYHFAPQTEYFKSDSGAPDIRRGFETITYVGDRGVLVFDPNTGQTTDILQPDAFARETEKTGGLLSLDMSTVGHNLRENNPVLTAMAKDALRATIAMLGTAIPAPDGTLADMGVLAQRGQFLEEKLQALQ